MRVPHGLARFAGGFGGPEWPSRRCLKMRVPHGMARFDGDFGVGIIAGIGMAIIAIIIDRMTHAWSRKRQEELGLSVE